MSRSQKRILAFAPFGTHTVHHQLDAVVCSALRLRGSEVAAVLCDGLYPDCHATMWAKDRAEACRNCAAMGQQLFQSFGLPTMQLRTFITAEDRARCETWIASLDQNNYANATYAGVPIGDWVTPAIHSRFRIKSHNLTRPDIKAVHRQYLIDGLLSYFGICKLYETFRPTHVLNWGAWLNSYRVAYEVARSRGIDVLSHEKFFNELTEGGTFSVESNVVTSRVQNPLLMSHVWKDVPLSPEELKQAHTYFETLEKKGGFGFYNFVSAAHDVRTRLNIPPNAKVVGIFTSSEYELSTHPDFKNAPDQIEVIDKLFELFRDTDYYVVVRHHPNIGRYSRGHSETDLITRLYEQAWRAPKNVRVIMPHEKLTSYALMWHLDIVFSFYSTIAIEASARAIPAAIFDCAIYRDSVKHRIGVQYTTEELKKTVEGLIAQSNNFTVEDLRRLYRATYAVLFRFAKTFKSFRIKEGNGADIRITNLSQLAPGNDPELDLICEHVLRGKPLEKFPEQREFERDHEPENEFFSSELVRLNSRRSEIRNTLAGAANEQKQPPIAVLRFIDASRGEATHEQPPWLSRTRHHHLLIETAPVNYGSPARDALVSIQQWLAKRTETYCQICTDRFAYDECFHTSLYNAITNDASGRQLTGARYGAWIRGATGAIDRAIFTKDSVAADIDAVPGICVALMFPLFHLCFGIYRRDALLAAVSAALDRTTPRETSEVLFEFAFGPDVHHIDVPMALFDDDCKTSPVDNSTRATSIITVESLIADGIELLQRGEFNQALGLFDSVLHQDNQLPQAWFGRGLATMSLGHTADAAHAFRTVLKSVPNHEESKALLAEIESRA